MSINIKKALKETLEDKKIILVMFIYLFVFILSFFINSDINSNNNNEIQVIEKIIYIDRYYNNNEDIQFNENNVRIKSNISEEELKEILKDTNLKDLSSTIIKAENDYNINAIFLTSLIINNSNWGNSERSIKYNNLTNMGVFNENSIGKIYNSKEESILDCANLLDREYLSDNGMYFNGYSIEDISKNFCDSEIWINDIKDICNDIINRFKN